MNPRVKLIIKAEDLVPIFIGGYWCRSICPYLPDTRIIETHWNAEKNGIIMTLEHPQFPKVESGKEPLIRFRIEEKKSGPPRFGFFLKTLEELRREERDNG